MSLSQTLKLRFTRLGAFIISNSTVLKPVTVQTRTNYGYAIIRWDNNPHRGAQVDSTPLYFHIAETRLLQQQCSEIHTENLYCFLWKCAFYFVSSIKCDAIDCRHTSGHAEYVWACVSAVNSSWTTRCLSTANLLCSNGAQSSIRGVDVFLSLSAGLTGARRRLQPLPREVSQLDMPVHPVHPANPSNIDTHTHEREQRQTSVWAWPRSQTESASPLLLNLSLPLAVFSHTQIHTNMHAHTQKHARTLTKLTCQLQSDQEQKDSCQFEADIINGFGGGGRALKTKRVQGRADLKCTFILAGTLAFWFQPLYANISLRVSLTFIITGNRGACKTLLCWWREMWHP